jgi:peptidoglycan/xylan/chitin deacetylase (PgdA/CDA1 family)
LAGDTVAGLTWTLAMSFPISTLGEKISFRLAMHLPVATWRANRAGAIVSFTFDDAPASAASEGAPILESFGIRGTYYLCGGRLGGPGDLTQLLDRGQAEALARAGHEIGCHTFGHTDVRYIDWPSLTSSLRKNAETLSEISGAVPRNFAYPFGGISFGKKLRLRSCFDTCRGIYPGINVGKIDPGLLSAVPLYADTLDEDGVRHWIAEAVAASGWLIFFTHDVSETPTPFGVTPDLLRVAVTAALEAGCACLPVADAVDRLRPPEAVRAAKPAVREV